LKNINALLTAGRFYFISKMDSKLMQKVEELTLYIIEQQKQIDELKKKVEVLTNKK